ncbi:MAG: Flp pilus assembly protein CpaB [Sphingomonadales bacterium 32-68-7]|nr:MAG: Flp pilus assembly protein CpaB [Sphingomonadales bacterium 12-68-11]OYX08914.1 MAG: Flp pilus assembly protein CpaB [Sphingomonadales bacterium 32-68-7]
MDRKKLVLLIGALVIAIGTALAARSMFAGAAAPEVVAATPQAQPEGPKVLVAKRALPVGTIITADAIGFQLWPKEMVQDAYFIDGEADMAKLIGTVVRYQITAGEPVTQGSLVSPGDRGFLAAALGPGMRAVTVAVSAKTGVAGFVFPGDYVDLMLTQSVGGGDGPELKATETILRNLRVLATDQSTETTKTEDGRTEVREFRMVTMEVTPRIAEKIAVAETLGSLSLALRSIADNQAELDRAIAAGEVDVPAGATKEQEEQLLRQAVARPQEGATSFVTGGDVSRFQRRTVPRPAPAVATSTSGSYVNSQGQTVAPAPRGPVVRVTRGQATVEEPAGPVGSLNRGVSTGLRNTGATVPSALSTLK